MGGLEKMTLGYIDYMAHILKDLYSPAPPSHTFMIKIKEKQAQACLFINSINLNSKLH